MCLRVTTNTRPTTLVAVLLNPPLTTSGVRTILAVDRASAVLGYESVRVVNLFAEATPTVAELNARITRPCSRARPNLRQALKDADGLLGAWGVSGLTGQAREAKQRQLRWFFQQATAADFSHIWMVGGEPRHPSRWHQYLSDKYRRTGGGSFTARLEEALSSVPIGSI